MIVPKVKIEGLNSLHNKFQALKVKAGRDKRKANASVGYAMPYAVYVHENLDAFHPTGQARFLSTAARRYRTQIANTIAVVSKRTKSVEQGVLAGAKLLLSLSQNLVPIDTRALYESGYACLTADAATAAATALARGIARRHRVLKRRAM